MAEAATPMVEVDTIGFASAISGYLLTRDIGDVYRALEAFFGFAPFTHQLSRLGRELEAHVKAAMPEFPGSTEAKAFGVNADTYAAYAASLVERWGARVSVPALAPSEPRDPVAELVEMVGPERVVVVATQSEAA